MSETKHPILLGAMNGSWILAGIPGLIADGYVVYLERGKGVVAITESCMTNTWWPR